MDDRSLPRLPIELIEAIVDRSDAASQRSFALTCKLLLHRARLNISFPIRELTPQLQTLEIENATGLGIKRLKLDYVPFDSLVSWHYALSAIPLLNDLSVVDIEFMPDADHTLPPDARHLHLQALEMSYINELDLMSGWVQAVVPIDSLRHLSLSLSYPEDADIASTLFEHFGPSLRSIELVLDRMQAGKY
ncbi:hypothetical protein PUNSTDRAFT_52059 [Punctularia strigosozonata HHB-11173 SS5]|uniref:uncharacterized protein n=1 Tax=Punctularia strigosozonata (strain HHB-11173) TaxID=741275 RepID=UPI00044184F2|nr:uncharacterized protein PUNSTDRAFT_52059 [Punctularia strigosozonata HHB-11173 SS5]EIN09903.1 hypothetical protein PUNSTDRAFT_52059 [Punctularia strigosozonata HHB-11173 SS5]